jgi:hypothetical protein
MRVLPQSPGPAPGRPDSHPAGLLEDLLEQASHPGVKGRAAVPVRGAVTGARPLLSAALLVGGAAVGGGVGYACWRTTQRLRTLAGRSAA